MACVGCRKKLSENSRPYVAFYFNCIFRDIFLEYSSMNFIMCITLYNHHHK